MKNTSKLIKIIESHIKTICGIDGDKYIPDNELIRRKEICSKCPKNSLNISESKLSIVGKLRHQVHKPFCTACSCPLEEKQKTPTEECGLVYLNEKPLWSRILVETTGKTPNMINMSPENINISNNISEYIVYVDYIEEDTKFSVLFDTKEGDGVVEATYTIKNLVHDTCKLSIDELDVQDIYIGITCSLKYNEIPSGEYKQRIIITYNSSSGDIKQIPLVVFFRKR